LKPKKGDTVTQANPLIEAGSKMTLVEKRFLLLGISRINPMRKEGAPLEFYITVDQWRDAYPDDPTPWRSLDRGSEGLARRFVLFRESINPKDTWSRARFTWLSGVRYWDGEGLVRVKFGLDISEFLTGNLEQFTSIPLLELGRFRSTHAIRLYELMNQYKYTGYLKISLEDFRFSMGCKYPDVRDLRKKVALVALKEINKQSRFDISFQQIKRGRTITHFVFEFTPDTRKQKQASHDAPIENTDPDNPARQKTRDRSLNEDLYDRSWAS